MNKIEEFFSTPTQLLIAHEESSGDLVVCIRKDGRDHSVRLTKSTQDAALARLDQIKEKIRGFCELAEKHKYAVNPILRLLGLKAEK